MKIKTYEGNNEKFWERRMRGVKGACWHPKRGKRKGDVVWREWDGNRDRDKRKERWRWEKKGEGSTWSRETKTRVLSEVISCSNSNIPTFSSHSYSLVGTHGFTLKTHHWMNIILRWTKSQVPWRSACWWER